MYINPSALCQKGMLEFLGKEIRRGRLSYDGPLKRLENGEYIPVLSNEYLSECEKFFWHGGKR